MPDFRSRRLAVALGTSGGGMRSFEDALARLDTGRPIDLELARRCPYFGPIDALLSRLGASAELCTQLLAACASSTFAIGQALTWLSIGAADLVIAGGYDAVSPFIASGFECLGATSEAPAPFRVSRDGLALGEGAALLALCRGSEAPFGAVLGFGATSDALHVTAPDRSGAGLARAARGALEDAGVEACDVRSVSAHGTGTPYNDAAEAHALREVFGSNSADVVVHALKGAIGHTLGAGGAIESLFALAACRQGVAPATTGDGPVEPALHARILERAEATEARVCLKLSSAFGGANAALVLSAKHDPKPEVAPRRVKLLRIGTPVLRSDPRQLEGRVLTDAIKLDRMDGLSALTVAAVLDASAGLSLSDRTAVIVGTAAATLEIDADFERRRRRRGPEPRRFPATSPNLCAGECTIALGLHGPSFSVGASPAAAIEALLVAHDWISAGRVDFALVVAAELIGDAVGALWQAAEWPLPAQGAIAAVLGVDGAEALSRQRLAAALFAAREGRGALGGEAPGWPSFRAALARAAALA